MNKIFLCLPILLSLLLSPPSAVGQEDPAPPAPAEAQEPARDPFKTSPPIRSAAAAAGLRSGGGRAEDPQPRPPLTLRGIFKLRGQEPGALLALGERSVVVRPGEQIHTGGSVPEGTLFILEIKGGSLQVRWGGDKAPLVLR